MKNNSKIGSSYRIEYFLLNTESGSLCSTDSTFGGSSLSSVAFSSVEVFSVVVDPIVLLAVSPNCMVGFANTDWLSVVVLWDENRTELDCEDIGDLGDDEPIIRSIGDYLPNY